MTPLPCLCLLLALLASVASLRMPRPLRASLRLASVDDFSRPAPAPKPPVASEEPPVVAEQEEQRKEISDAMRDRLKREMRSQVPSRPNLT